MELMLVILVVIATLAALVVARRNARTGFRRRILAGLAVILLLCSYNTIGIWVVIFGSFVIVVVVRFLESTIDNPN